MAMNLCFRSPSWKDRHDLHRHRHDTMISIILISINVSPSGLSRPACFYYYCYRSDKVKHYIALNDWHAGHTIIKDNPMAPAGCCTHRHASRDNLYITWSSHTSHISHHVIGHITSQHSLQKQVRCPLIVVACFTWLLRLSSKNNSHLRKNHNGDTLVAFQPSQGPPLSNPIQLN